MLLKTKNASGNTLQQTHRFEEYMTGILCSVTCPFELQRHLRSSSRSNLSFELELANSQELVCDPLTNSVLNPLLLAQHTSFLLVCLFYCTQNTTEEMDNYHKDCVFNKTLGL